jgi:hypothetical protein
MSADTTLSYVQALAWPIVVILALTLFRVEIRKAMRRLSELQLPGGAAMKFIDDRIELIDRFSTATATNVDEEVRQANSTTFEQVKREYVELTALASKKPREAILRSWVALSDFAYAQGGAPGYAAPLVDLVSRLVRKDSVPMCSETIRALSETYGEITSGWSQVTATGARHFVHAVERVVLEILAGSLSKQRS